MRKLMDLVPNVLLVATINRKDGLNFNKTNSPIEDLLGKPRWSRVVLKMYAGRCEYKLSYCATMKVRLDYRRI
jgi:hypothetical protein